MAGSVSSDGHETYQHAGRTARPGDTMSDTSGVSGDDPDAYDDERVVPCPACESPNTVQIAARGLQYQCRDCNNEFGPPGGPME
jgi:hypothetical protein